MIQDRNTTVLAKDYKSTKELKTFVEKCTGAKMFPVKGKPNAFWLSGDKRGGYLKQKKYKIVFGEVTQVSYSHDNKYSEPAKKERSGYGFYIQAPGDYDGWSLMGSYRTMISETMKEFKERKETA